MGINTYNPLQSDIFKEKFVDDDTPLNAQNLNPILDAILLVNENNNSSSTNLQSQISTEKTSREDADKKLYGADIPEEGYLTLTGIDESFRSSDATLKKELQTQINEEKTALQTQISTEKTALQNQIETKENAFSVMITDGGGVPQSVIDGINTTWNGEFEEV